MFDFLRRRIGERATGPTIFGDIEVLSESEAAGWIADGRGLTAPLQVRVMCGDILICEGVADRPRPDIDLIYKVSGARAFRLPAPKGAGRARKTLQLSVRAGSEQEWVHVTTSAIGSYVPSATWAIDPELRPLRLDLIKGGGERGPLDGLSILEVGCGPRGLYRFAARLGARRVVIADPEHATSEADRRSVDHVFHALWDIPNEEFDVIYLPVLHLESRPKRYLRMLQHHLSAGGVLILECRIGRSRGIYRTAWTAVREGGVLRRFPSHSLLTEDLLEGYSARQVSSSGGDKETIQTKVFHCRVMRPIVVLVSGKGGTGKSVLCRTLGSKGFRTFPLDAFLRRLVQDDGYQGSKLPELLRPFRESPSMERLDQVGRTIVQARLHDELAAALLQDLALETAVLFIEGEILVHDAIRSAIERALQAQGVSVWTMTPSLTRQA